jgi:hypothetical protein
VKNWVETSNSKYFALKRWFFEGNGTWGTRLVPQAFWACRPLVYRRN